MSTTGSFPQSRDSREVRIATERMERNCVQNERNILALEGSRVAVIAKRMGIPEEAVARQLKAYEKIAVLKNPK